MATLDELVRQGALTMVAPLEDLGEQKRWMYASPRFQTFRDTRVHGITATMLPDVPAGDQLEAIIADFLSGEAIVLSRMFKNLRGDPRCIWELKTPDLRIFGWFVRKDHFVLDEGWSADETKAADLYEGFVNQTVRFRTLLDLDEPKNVPGTDPSAVVSNLRDESSRLPRR